MVSILGDPYRLHFQNKELGRARFSFQIKLRFQIYALDFETIISSFPEVKTIVSTGKKPKTKYISNEVDMMHDVI